MSARIARIRTTLHRTTLILSAVVLLLSSLLLLVVLLLLLSFILSSLSLFKSPALASPVGAPEGVEEVSEVEGGVVVSEDVDSSCFLSSVCGVAALALFFFFFFFALLLGMAD